jgi:hypothetical protein
VLVVKRPLWLRHCVTALWLAGWSALLWVVHSPWRGLGGLVSERLRWLERFVLAAGLIVGSGLGEIVCGAAESRFVRARRVRMLLYPAAVVGAGVMTVLRLTGRNDLIGVVLTGLVSFIGGAWMAFVGGGPTIPPGRDRGRPPKG